MIIANLVLSSYQQSLEKALDVISNNVANSSTTGFKRQEVKFDSLIENPDLSPADAVDFGVERGTYRDTSAGPLLATGNPLDIAIQGEGYFAVQTKDGIRYTRGGALQLDNQGAVTTASGDKLLGDGDQPITVPSDASNLHISADGVITARTGSDTTAVQLGKLKAVKFANEQRLQTVGGGLYSADESPEPDPHSHFVQGMIEQSNVQSITEMTRMIEILRNYQMATHMIDQDNKRQTDSIDRLSKATA